MTHRLRVAAVSSAARLRGALPPGQADSHGDYDGDVLVVPDEADAAALVAQYHNVTWADGDDDPVPDPTVQRANVDSDAAAYECGVNGCSRDVDSRDATCWQHDADAEV